MLWVAGFSTQAHRQQVLMRPPRLPSTALHCTALPQIIPAENLVAAFQGNSRATLLAAAPDCAASRVMLEALETGTDGVLLQTDSPTEVRAVLCLRLHSFSLLLRLPAGCLDGCRLDGWMVIAYRLTKRVCFLLQVRALMRYLEEQRQQGAQQLQYETATVTAVRPVGMGDRACVDLCRWGRDWAGLGLQQLWLPGHGADDEGKQLLACVGIAVSDQKPPPMCCRLTPPLLAPHCPRRSAACCSPGRACWWAALPVPSSWCTASVRRAGILPAGLSGSMPARCTLTCSSPRGAPGTSASCSLGQR